VNIGIARAADVRSAARVSERPSAPDIVEALLQQAVVRRASDIHFEPGADGMVVRFRVDGLLQQVSTIPMSERAAVVSRIKILANLDIAEHRLPHDGRIRLVRHGRTVDLRVSTVPSLHGEKVVLRILDLASISIPLSRSGLSPDHFEALVALARRPQGTILVTGPTGSGKTSTIYACLNEIKSDTTNIVTIEDPIEYEIGGITQIAVHEKIGLTFAHCLRSVLRQDPDVILVGEIRDLETARIAMQASLTGHLVFATLHTNDAVGAITRLVDMEIPPYLIASSLSAVLAQRLVRRLCAACKVPWVPDAATRATLGVGSERELVLYRPGRCEACHGSGVVGRTAIFELVPVTDDLRALIGGRSSEVDLRACAREEGARSLFVDGLQKVLDGSVALEELRRVAEPDSGEGRPRLA
jgi:general secretion pathway protein E